MLPSTHSNTDFSLDLLLRSAADGIFVLDRNRQFVLYNDACERLTGYKADELIDSNCHCREVMDCRDEYDRPLSAALCPADGLFDGSVPSARQKMKIRRRDGSRLWIETAYTPVASGAGEVEWVMGIMRDITEAKVRELETAQELNDAHRHGDTPATAAAGALHGLPTVGETTATAETLRLDDILARVEREAIQRALNAAGRQRNRAAQLMGISRSRLYRRMEALGINPNDAV